MRYRIADCIVTVLEIGGIACLAGIAINAEWKRHKAEKELSDVKLECSIQKFCNYVNSIKIKDLEKELKELKAKGEA